MYITRANLISAMEMKHKGRPYRPYANDPPGSEPDHRLQRKRGPTLRGRLPSQPMRHRTGSHNLVLGEVNGYTLVGGIGGVRKLDFRPVRDDHRRGI